MARTPQRDVTKLPQWAQDRIAQLTRERNDARGRVSQIEITATNVIADPYGTPPKPLEPGTIIVFALGRRYDDGHPADYIMAQIETLATGRSRVRIQASDGMRIYPRSSNVMALELGR